MLLPLWCRRVLAGPVLLGVVSVIVGVAGCDSTARDIVALSNEGIRYLERQEHSRARERFQAVLKLDPDDGDAHFYLGSIALHEEKWPVAADHLRKATLGDPRRVDAHLLLAKALAEAGHPNDALAAAEGVFKLDPGHPQARLLVARLAAAGGNLAVADKALRAAIAGDPGFAPAYSKLAALYSDVGAFEAARTVLEEGLKFSPDSAELQESLGVAWLDLGRPDRARHVLDPAVGNPKARPQAHVNLAAALLQLGEYDAATQALRAFLLQKRGDKDPTVDAAARMLLKLKSRPR